MRSSAKAKAVRASIGNIAQKASEIGFVEADLNSDAEWGEAVVGAKYVLHVASPVPVTDPKNDEELIRPARDGTLRVLKAARDAGVKRVVMTSSISAIIFGRGVCEKPFTEEDWDRRDQPPRDIPSDDRAKTIAERAAWAWLAAEGGGLEPCHRQPWTGSRPVLGSDYSASIEAIKKLLDGSIPALPRFGFNVVDVRDIARLHVLAMTTPEAAGERFHRLRRFLLDVRRRQDAQAGTWGPGEERSLDPRPRLRGANGGVVRSDCPGDGSTSSGSGDRSRRRRPGAYWAGTPRPITETVLDTARSLQASDLK